MMLNKLHKKLKKNWHFTIIDKEEMHYYQPGFLFIPFGIYDAKDVIKPKSDFFPKGVTFIKDEVQSINAEDQEIVLSRDVISYDLLIVATGTAPVPEETPGLKGKLWYQDIFDFYTYQGATQLANKLKNWEGGKLVINIAESIIKCPIAPLEFAFLADAYFTEKGIRDQVEIIYTTPLSGAFTKPIATKMLSELLDEKNIQVIPDFYLESVDNDRKQLVSYDGQEVAFDLLVSIPVNKGADMVEQSGMGDEDDLNFIPTDKHTLQSKQHENIFVIGDATNLPTSKAGSVAHFEADVLEANILSYIKGKPLEAHFDGHANCFIETGFGKATLIDFDYDHEPYPGRYPFPVVGPMGLLKVNRANHLGKLAFEWVYWHMMLTGKKIPVSSKYSTKGKEIPALETA